MNTGLLFVEFCFGDVLFTRYVFRLEETVVYTLLRLSECWGLSTHTVSRFIEGCNEYLPVFCFSGEDGLSDWIQSTSTDYRYDRARKSDDPWFINI